MELTNQNTNQHLDLSKAKNRFNIYMLVIIIATFISVICVTIITGIWFWLVSSNNLGRQEHKGVHVAMFVFAIIDIVFMALWTLAMIGNIIVLKKIHINNKVRISIHYISVLALYIVFGGVALGLFYNYVTWRIMDPDQRQIALGFVGGLEVLRIALLLSILVTSIIYLVKNKKSKLVQNDTNMVENNSQPVIVSEPSINSSNIPSDVTISKKSKQDSQNTPSTFDKEHNNF